MIEVLYAEINATKAKCRYAYKVVFYKDPMSIEDTILMPIVSFRSQKMYTYLSPDEYNIGDTVMVLSRKPIGLVPGVAVIVETMNYEEAKVDAQVSSPTTGFIIGGTAYSSYWRKMIDKEEQKRQELAELRKLISLEKEKVLLSQVVSTNPELAKKIEAFRLAYPSTSIMGENHATAND